MVQSGMFKICFEDITRQSRKTFDLPANDRLPLVQKSKSNGNNNVEARFPN
jgi:hypothetical protein